MDPLYLSRLRLNARSHEAQRDIANCVAMHQRVLTAFPDQPDIDRARAHFAALYRLEFTSAGAEILVQSQMPPDWSRLPADYLREPPDAPKRVDVFYDGIKPGQTLLFRLRANPTRRLSGRGQANPERWRGKRVELRSERDQLDWLTRKGQSSGFAVVAVHATPDPTGAFGVRSAAGRGADGEEGSQLTFGSVLFEGRLRVTDPDDFRVALASGIGSGKAFGFSLLSVASPAGAS